MSPEKIEPKYLAWMDLETTGLDMHRDVIIEVALVITDMNLEVQGPPFTSQVRGDNWLFWIERDKYVNEMHTKTGLKEELWRGHGLSYRSVTKKLVRELNQVGNPQEFLIAGSGVAAFDLPWIKLHLPDVASFLQYRSIDVGHIRRFVKDICGLDVLPEAKEAHRALGDVMEFLQQAKALRSYLTTDPFPTEESA